MSIRFGSLVALAACSTSAAPPPAQRAPAVATAELSGTSLFCAPGSIGLRPDPLPPDYDAEYVVVVIDVDNPGDPVSGVTLGAVELLDANSAPRAHARKIQELGAFPPTTTLPPLASAGSWAIYSDSKIPAFAGTLVHGHNRLRIRAWLDVAAFDAAKVRVTIGNADHHVVIDGPLTGAFPS
jgi:hypothetical protein